MKNELKDKLEKQSFIERIFDSSAFFCKMALKLHSLSSETPKNTL